MVRNVDAEVRRRANRGLSLLAVVALMAALSHACAAANLISDPGFELSTFSKDGYAPWFVAKGPWIAQAVGPPSHGAGSESLQSWGPGRKTHSGANAMRVWTSARADTYCPSLLIVYQDVEVVGGQNYVASVWALPLSFGAGGFGESPTDSAGIIVREYDETGAEVVEHAKAALTSAESDFRQVSLQFTSRPDTVRVRFILDSVYTCSSIQGYIIYDDACLEGSAPEIGTITGTVTSADGGPVAGALVTANDVSAITAGNGAYTLADLAVTGWPAAVTVLCEGYYPLSTSAALRAGTNALDLVITPIPQGNLLVNGGFADGVAHAAEKGDGYTTQYQGWTYNLPNEIMIAYPESYPGYASTDFHPAGAVDALRLRKFVNNGVAGDVIVYQDVSACPSAAYRASLWVRARGIPGVSGFGAHDSDVAELVVEEFDRAGASLAANKARISAPNSGFERMMIPFSTSAEADSVRFTIHARLSCHYSQGDVTVDDCALEGPAPPDSLAGTVSNPEGQPLPGAVVMIGSRSAVAGANGAYLLDGVSISSGRTEVRAGKDGYYAQTKQRSFGHGRSNLDFVLYPRNLLVNAGFDDYGFDGWSRSSNAYCKVWPSADPGLAHSGDVSVLFESTGDGSVAEGWAYQDVWVAPGRSYTAECRLELDKSVPNDNWADPSQVAEMLVVEYRSGSDGSAIPGGSHAVRADNVPGYQTLSVGFVATADTRRVRILGHCRYPAIGDRARFDSFELNGSAPAGGFYGIVTSGANRLGWAQVRVTDLSTVPSTVVAVRTADELGAWSVAGLPAGGRYELRASNPCYYAQRKSRNVAANTMVNFDLAAVNDNLLSEPGFDDGFSLGGAWCAQNSDAAVVGRESAHAILGPPLYHSGEEAAAVMSPSGNSGGSIFQEVAVVPGTTYTAKVRFCANAPGESIWGSVGDAQWAALTIRQYDAAGSQVGAELTATAAETVGWETLSLPFTTSSYTASVRIAGTAHLLDDYSQSMSHAVFDSFQLNGPRVTGVSITQAKALPDGAGVDLNSKVVTAVFEGSFYVQELNEFSGIKVTGTATLGSIVDLTGFMTTTAGERAVDTGGRPIIERGTLDVSGPANTTEQ